jgi:hypothetical protein
MIGRFRKVLSGVLRFMMDLRKRLCQGTCRWREPESKVAGDPWLCFLQARLLDRMGGREGEAFQFHLWAAQRGLPVAATCVGLAYGSGNGVLRDPVAAQAWLQLASYLGDPGAEVVLTPSNPKRPSGDG